MDGERAVPGINNVPIAGVGTIHRHVRAIVAVEVRENRLVGAEAEGNVERQSRRASQDIPVTIRRPENSVIRFTVTFVIGRKDFVTASAPIHEVDPEGAPQDIPDAV